MPTLGRYCESCHGMREQHGGLRLDNYDNLMRGGDSGPVVIARAPKDSLLLAKIEHRDRPSMPPRKWLPKAAIARIRAWIIAGARTVSRRRGAAPRRQRQRSSTGSSRRRR